MRASLLKLILFKLIFVFSLNGFGFDIPNNLDENEREQTASVLGYGTALKFLSSPYTLGGYSGFELGISLESIGLEKLETLGSTVSEQSPLQFSRLSIGKGVYNNVDVFLNFTPFSTQNNITDYGLIVKWMFYEALYKPINISLLLNSNTINIKDRYLNTNIGADIIFGLSMKNIKMIIGVGQLRSSSRFLGTDGTINYTDSGSNEKFNATILHYLFGLNYQLNEYFVSFEIDRYKQPVYSSKVGIRF